MRHFPNRQAFVEALVELFEEHGVRIVQRDSERFALFLDDDPCAPMPVASVSIDMFAATLERKLS
ncbi:hypothetical protein SAMN05892877_12359 [Rhizobium subbaraonis]|uniref:Uncharacterized protein n=1 Tax=Rhizobium subbaraonis TaxID=908946 RepID=A0A285UXS9_9HYPH|nr:hypothetical protein [Rhizobium subbaraonis]SOC46620.1 hypothetical protein SAMN05892877_12359 [Rhizobium subbaraonis]